MICNPINDAACLDQLTTIACELVPTTVIQTVARRLGTRDSVIRWLHSLPQANDHGEERVRFVQCDVPQRARLLPDDPNCVERAMGAMMLLEVIDPATPRALATVDRPERHTGVVEKRGNRWYAVDLFPRRNGFSWGDFGKDVLQGVHKYVGQPLLGAYGLGSAGEWLGNQENKWIGRDKPEKKQSPPPERKQSEQQGSGVAAGVASQASSALVSRVVGSGASKSGGQQDGKEGKVQGAASGGAAARPVAGARNAPSAAGDAGDSHDEGAFAQRFWWLHGR